MGGTAPRGEAGGEPQRASDMPRFPGADRMRKLMPEGGEFGENLLRRRFFAVPRFKALYQERFREMHRRILVDGLARQRLEHHADVVRRALRERPSLVDAARFDALVASNLEFLDQRRDALAARDPVKR